VKSFIILLAPLSVITMHLPNISQCPRMILVGWMYLLTLGLHVLQVEVISRIKRLQTWWHRAISGYSEHFRESG